MTHRYTKVKQRKPQSTLTATTSRPPTVDEFLKVNPLPAQLNHLGPSLRKLPSVSMLLEIMMGCLAYDMSGADLDRIIADVGEMFSQERQRCAACFCWAPQFHAIVVGKAERFAVVPMCERGLTKNVHVAVGERLRTAAISNTNVGNCGAPGLSSLYPGAVYGY